MKVNDSYCLIIDIKSTTFALNIKVSSLSGRGNAFLKTRNFRHFWFVVIDN
jgi:hypothetical protein